MIEYLLGYVDKLEELLFKEPKLEGIIDNERYLVVMDLKKFIFSDLVPYFIDEDIKYLKNIKEPTRDLVSKTIIRWEEFCTKYPDYLNQKKIKDYIIGQLIQDE